MPLTDILGFRHEQFGRLQSGHHRPVYLAESLATAAVVLLLLVPTGEAAQHEQHHPAGQPSGDEQTPDPGTVPGEAGGMGMGPGGGMGDMDEMMEQMGAPKPRELYPSLMSLPDLAPEERQELQDRAHERMRSGAALMSSGLASLTDAAPTDDFAVMQEAVALLREGLAQFDSGLATHRALAEGKAPKNVALYWFKKEMGLLPNAGVVAPQTSGPFGLPWIHAFVMVILVVFFAAMIWMYFFKMRRAGLLLEQLAGSQAVAASSPPPTAPPSAPSENAAASPPAPGASTSAVDPPPSAELGDPEPSSADVPVALKTRVRKWTGRLRLTRIFDETANVKTFRFTDTDGGPLPFVYAPGQFLVLSLEIKGKRVKRSYTIASAPSQQQYCEITVKREEKGVVSRFLHDQLREGDMVEITAPNGKFTFTGDEADSIALIGGGVGITPLMSVLRYLVDTGWGKDIYLLYSCRTSRDFIFREELEFYQRRHPNLHVVATMTRAEGTVWMGLKDRFNKELIAQACPEIASRRVHVCGPPPMMEAVTTMLKELGVPEDNLHTEAFGPAARPAAPSAKAPPSTSASPTQATQAVVRFEKSAKSAPLPADRTVLDVAEENDVEIDYSCRVGSCGTCTVKLLSGEVSMEVEDGLEPEDKDAGMILACQAKATADVAVDA